jgi:hypothetical protein
VYAPELAAVDDPQLSEEILQAGAAALIRQGGTSGGDR